MKKVKLLGMFAVAVLIALADSGTSFGAGPYTVVLTCPDGTTISGTGYYSASVAPNYIECDGVRTYCPRYWCSYWCWDGTEGGGRVYSGEECNALGERLCDEHGGVKALGLDPD
jgi:hypothetical protein